MTSAPFPPVGIPTVTVAAHMLTDAGSALARARDLLALARLSDPHLDQRLTQGIRLVSGVRLVVDAHLSIARSLELGAEVPAAALEELELGLAMLSE